MKKWLQEFFKGLIEVDVYVDHRCGEVIELTREHEQAKVLLNQFHEAYRDCMANQGFIDAYSAAFYPVAKRTAQMLDIPLWKNMTPPTGMPVSGGEPLLSRVKGG